MVGAGGFGRVVLEHAIKQYECAFLDDGPLTCVDGVSVVGRIADLEKLYPGYRLVCVTIGNNALRERIYKRAAEIGYEFPNLIVPSAYISPHARLGRGVIVLNNAVVQNHTICGDGVILNPGVELHHDSTVGNHCLIYTNSVVRSLAQVGDRVWIGSTATIATGARVPSDSVVRDGAVFPAEEDS